MYEYIYIEKRLNIGIYKCENTTTSTLTSILKNVITYFLK